VDEVSFEVADKEFVVLVGPSGCGKSTTLRMIAGLEEPTSGEIFIDQRNVTKIAPKDRDIAMVFQNYSLYPHLNVYENLAFSLRMRKYPKKVIAEKVGKAAEILNIDKLLTRKPRELSGGQRQRVALGRAIVREPKVFLFDEPLSNLDAKLRVQMRTEILKLHKRVQTTAIYVTHDQMEAMTMGDRIVALKDGRIQQYDDPLTLYHRPANIFVAGFIGSPAMNFIPYELLTNQGGKSTLGVRPENLHLNGREDYDFTLKGIMEVSEKMGHETLYHIRVNDFILIARVMGEISQACYGEAIEIGFNRSDCHFFDENGIAIQAF
jgi:multiple sugar transport system ATP-binding protein